MYQDLKIFKLSNLNEVIYIIVVEVWIFRFYVEKSMPISEKNYEASLHTFLIEFQHHSYSVWATFFFISENENSSQE